MFKPMIGKAEDPIIRRRIGRKQSQIVYSRDSGSDKRTKTIETNAADQVKRAFSDEEAKILSKWCVDIEKHYSEVHGHATPMDIEWAKDGETGELFVVQARPETVRSRVKEGCFTTVEIKEHGPVVIEGTAIGKIHSLFSSFVCSMSDSNEKLSSS